MLASEQSNVQGSTPDQGGERVSASPPAISIPKGGGAIPGIGEKFGTNPVTGTGSMTLPIAATSPGRSGFGPQLSLSYDSGSGNGPFGFGWSLSLPQITRKTDKGLPKYQDAEDSDVFILSGAEDLVPMFQKDQDGKWVFDDNGNHVFDEFDRDGYKVRRYRPRIEGLFARIERWTNLQTGEIHWRSISRDNVTTLYGKDNESRIFDPADAEPDHPSRIFSWLICQSYDDKGNAIFYEYAAENSDRISEDNQGNPVTLAHERNRNNETRKANRYLKRIRYGNRISRLIQPDLTQTDWMFEVVFDYGEGHFEELPLDPAFAEAEQHHFVSASKLPDFPWDAEQRNWPVRHDPFSTYRAGFEIRAYRLCRRVLMFHHFPDELGRDDYLVRSTAFTYQESPIASFITSVTQSGYVHKPTPDLQNRYLKKSLPSLEFEYSQPIIHDEVIEIDAESLENLPYGLDGATYRWVDLDGEGLSGVLTEQSGEWFYKPNLSPVPDPGENGHNGTKARFGPLQRVTEKPSLANLGSGAQQFLDMAGDGQLDLAMFAGPTPGFFERTQDESWEGFRTFPSLPNLDWNDPNLRFVDLSGDGHADILITEDTVFNWHLSLDEAGFGPREQVHQALDEEKGPRLVFNDSTQSIYLTDFSGDNLVDLARVCNGEICYWPNLGYGRFGAKVTMDNSPWFDAPDQFDQRRVRLADIDGSGTTDIIYLACDSIDIYRNQAGNSWSARDSLTSFPKVDNLSAVMAVDLLGNGTACLVWSSPLPGDADRPMRYIDLMAGGKPHLLIRSVNNLGAETRVHYASSTKFYLADKLAGKPWITRIPFPVHVVERVETYDRISRNCFVTRYAYHHGYFDGIEREFRGFGMVELWDTEEYAALSTSGDCPTGNNIDAASHVPPVHTKTWFHTGIYVGRDRVSNFFAGLLDAGDRGEYYREPEWRDNDDEARKRLLDDAALPAELTVSEEREACRALKGSMLRQEIYAQDGSDKESHPYTVTEQNFTLRCLQPQAGNRHAIFFTHPRESINTHYEREPGDPRIGHAMTLEVDDFGNVLKEAVIGYGRSQRIHMLDAQGGATEVANPGLDGLDADDQETQTKTLITYSENLFTVPEGYSGTENTSVSIDEDDNYRTPLPCETRTYELTGFDPEPNADRLTLDDLGKEQDEKFVLEFDEEISYEALANGGRQRRLIEQTRTRYRQDDLSSHLPFGELEPLALPYESYQLAFTAGLLTSVFNRVHDNQTEKLIPNSDRAAVLGGQSSDQGGYVDLEGNGRWWIPAGRMNFHPDPNIPPGDELAEAQRHFFLPRLFTDPFANPTAVEYDAHDLLPVCTQDAVGNNVTSKNNYRALQAERITDPNGNQGEVRFDALGLTVATAVMGKPGENKGDSLTGFQEDLSQTEIDRFFADPKGAVSETLLGGASTRFIYDLERYARLGDPNAPTYVATLARETHLNDSLPAGGLKIQVGFSYSDGFGREIQQKIQAEPGPLVANGPVIQPRWVGSGWTIFNNKGKPVRQYEPFFNATHDYEFARLVGVSPILFYDPVGRMVATIHPNNTWEKVVFDAWHQETWDVNDTVLSDPKGDPDVGDFFSRLLGPDLFDSWYARRIGGGLGNEEQSAAQKTAEHARTPTLAHFDSLGRTFLTVADNGLDNNGDPRLHKTRLVLDIEGNQRQVKDERTSSQGNLEERIVMRYDYDMLGSQMNLASMEAGERWTLISVAGNSIRAWNTRLHDLKTCYDALQRPTHRILLPESNAEMLVERMIYGEAHPDAGHNLRGQLYQHYDGAGLVANERFDFKGNLLESRRQLTGNQRYQGTMDWTPLKDLSDFQAIATAAAPLLDPNDNFVSQTKYDALNRPIQTVTPHSNPMQQNVTQPVYNEANLLEKIDVWLNQASLPNQLLDPSTAAFSPVTNIDYNARGQREFVKYGNDTTTTYVYDPETFRLSSITTIRATDSNGLAVQLFVNPLTVQDLHYTFDPVGNITNISDSVLLDTTYNNQTVQPVSEYVYDAVYRLVRAQGREHIGQTAFDFAPLQDNYDYRDYPFIGLRPGANDPKAMRTYTEEYDYDEVGNIHRMRHTAAGGDWTRFYHYLEPSLLEPGDTSDPGKTNNRLTYTQVGNGISSTESYGYTDAQGNDVQGCMTSINTMLMTWDFEDQLQVGDLVGGGTAYYVYDAAGQRVRKVIERQNGTRQKERIYLGGIEIYREYNGATQSEDLERETLHIMDSVSRPEGGNQQRIALVETRTKGNEPGVPHQIIRYQLGNHLGSASLELDGSGQIISYEEYTPYGSTSYQAVRSQTETPKRYRYTGKERDEENGMYYHGARYYMPWLGRWASCDPLPPLSDGMMSLAGTNRDSNKIVEQSGRSLKPRLLRSDVENKPNSMPSSRVNFYSALSSYAYAQLNPTLLVDPDGRDVVVFFSGFHQPREKPYRALKANELTTGKMAQEIRNFSKSEEIPDVDVLAFATGADMKKNVAETKKFITDHLGNTQKNEKVIIYGYSLGGEAAMRLAKELKNNKIPVADLIVVDSFVPDVNLDSVLGRVKGYFSKKNVASSDVSSNVMSGINFRQTTTSGQQGQIIKPESIIQDKVVSSTHANIDEAVRKDVMKRIKSDLSTRPDNDRRDVMNR